jgi:hypothetical protein
MRLAGVGCRRARERSSRADLAVTSSLGIAVRDRVELTLRDPRRDLIDA